MRSPEKVSKTDNVVLERDYHNLSPEEQRLLRLMVVVTEPLAPEMLRKAWDTLDEETPHSREKQQRSPRCAEVLKTLQDRGFMVNPLGMEGFWIVPDFLEALCLENLLKDSELLENLLRKGEALIPLQEFSAYLIYPREEGWKIYRAIRTSFYRKEWKKLKALLDLYHQVMSAPLEENLPSNPFLHLCTHPFLGSWLSGRLPLGLLLQALTEGTYKAFREEAWAHLLEPFRETLAKILEHLPRHSQDMMDRWGPSFFELYYPFVMLRGSDEYGVSQSQPKTPLDLLPGWPSEIRWAWQALGRGNFEESLLHWEKAVNLHSQKDLPSPFQELYLVTLFLQDNPLWWEKALGNLGKETGEASSWSSAMFRHFHLFRTDQMGATALLEGFWEHPDFSGQSPFIQLLSYLVLYWTSPETLQEEARSFLHHLCLSWENRGFSRFVLEGAAILHALEPEKFEPLWERSRNTISREQKPLVSLMETEMTWENLVESLRAVSKQEDPSSISRERLVWRLSLAYGKDGSQEVLDMVPYIQKRLPGGGWSSGRLYKEADAVAWDSPELPLLTPRDRRALEAMAFRESSGESFGALLEILTGHPLLFYGEPPFKGFSLLKGDLGLGVYTKKEGLFLKLIPTPTPRESREGFSLIQTSPDTLTFYPHQENLRGLIYTVLQGSHIPIPPQGEKVLFEGLRALTGLMPLESEMEKSIAPEDVTTHEGPPEPVLRIFPEGEGLCCELRVYPMGLEGPSYLPGRGAREILLPREGKVSRICRNRKDEITAVQEVLRLCPTLGREVSQDSWTWHGETTEEALELLLEIQECGDFMRVVWPQGETLKVTKPLSSESLSLKLSSRKEWFVVEGHVRVNEKKVMELQEIIKALQSPTGRFILLKDGEFLALTREFQRRLQDLETFALWKDREALLHPLTAPSLQPFFDKISHKDLCPQWHEAVKRFDQARKIAPSVPESFKGTLREYQIEGFQWLARMASLELGACLADDMGLGKTVQALVLLLHLASRGPSLVIAPTSVCPNWIEEARRFTPTLKTHFLSEGNRTERVSSMGPRDVLFCSYGLLQNEIESLEQVSWECVVLDEGQAIKNFRTQRSRKVMRLRGKFRLVTSGTPLENHLEELWTLFRFLNPGLLGSLKDFNTRFATPIEIQGNRHGAARLKKLLKPFILRRTKVTVLQELPPKTEILLPVVLSSQEREVYEALRRDALEETQTPGSSPGTRRVKILAAIMKLRRACCHSQLILPQSHPESSKLLALENILQELRENHHRALVFSQFVDHLRLVRAFLDERHVEYQYLDGSTSSKERQRQVALFQEGSALCFLISLRAGGMGLNLTGADYVIHLDPWWNPAVEDQASDRVHRIGQSRPVTIYRMVARDTIEEKIVELHKNKRELAENVLVGGEHVLDISMEDLIALLQDS